MLTAWIELEHPRRQGLTTADGQDPRYEQHGRSFAYSHSTRHETSFIKRREPEIGEGPLSADFDGCDGSLLLKQP